MSFIISSKLEMVKSRKRPSPVRLSIRKFSSVQPVGSRISSTVYCAESALSTASMSSSGHVGEELGATELVVDDARRGRSRRGR